MTEVRELIVDIGSGALDSDEDVPVAHLTLSPHHPSTHGLVRLHLRIQGEQIVSVTTDIGYMHRGAEKLLESRDYRQGLALANRHDWIGAFGGELGYAVTLESMLGLDVPERAQWLRTLVAELTRTISHLYFLGYFPLDALELDHQSGSPLTGNEHIYREQGQQLLEELTGGRVHPMFAHIGGLREDVPTGWLDSVSGFTQELRSNSQLIAPYLDHKTVQVRLRGVGRITPNTALDYGASGPIARASGIDVDLRRDQPYAAYAELGQVLRVVTATDGDVLARLTLLREQLAVSLDIIDACIVELAELSGPINVPLPKTLRAPEGIHYGWTETALGVSGYLVVSQGERMPWRVKLRTPSFAHLAVLSEVLVRQSVRDIAPIVASLFFVTGDSDR